MKTAVIVLVDGGGGAWCGPVFTVSTAPLSPVVEEAQRDQERDQEEGGSEEEITMRAAPLTLLHTQVSVWLSLATELLGLGGVEDVRGVGALTAVRVTGANHPLPPDPSYPLSSSPRPG